jgi:hypothetical protein
MALFNTPNLLGHIFAPQQFPEGGGGIEGLMSGYSAGSTVARQRKEEGAAYRAGEGEKPDYNFLTGAGGGMLGRSFKLSGQVAAERKNPLLAIQGVLAQQTAQMNQLALSEKMSDRQMQLRRQAGQSALMGFMAQNIGSEGYGSSEMQQSVLNIGLQHGIPFEVIKPHLEEMQKYHRAKELMKRAKDAHETIVDSAGNVTARNLKPAPSNVGKLMGERDELRNRMLEALDKGDWDGASRIMSDLQVYDQQLSESERTDVVRTGMRRNISNAMATLDELKAQKAAGAKFTKDMLRIDEAIAGVEAKIQSWERQLGGGDGGGGGEEEILQYNPATGEIE